jgi:excisionase family DNA binding protein
LSTTVLLTAEEAAAKLGVSRDFIYSHLDELPHKRLGDGPKAPIRIDAADLDAWGATKTAKVSGPLDAYREERRGLVNKISALRALPQTRKLVEPAHSNLVPGGMWVSDRTVADLTAEAEFNLLEIDRQIAQLEAA